MYSTLFLVNCTTSRNGDDKFCFCNTCAENEGNCDSHDECQHGLACGSNNCPVALGFNSEVDCCYQPATLGNCSTVNPCGEHEGDCDSHDECQHGLYCGSNNCLTSLGFDSEIDCCYQLTVGHEDFCTTVTPCGENEGDCDSNSECQSNHFCGSNNCLASLGFDTAIDCCSSTQIMSPNFPYSYPIYAEETWMLTAPSIGSIIFLQFQSFHVRLIVESKNRTIYEFRNLFLFIRLKHLIHMMMVHFIIMIL